MENLHFHPLSIDRSGDDFVITQTVGSTADDVVTIRISKDQAAQVAKFLSKKDSLVAKDSSPLREGFDAFWAEYPRKDGKVRALGIWERTRLGVDINLRETVMRHLAAVKVTDQWTKDGGRFVPHAATYLGQRRYLDEVEASEDESRYL